MEGRHPCFTSSNAVKKCNVLSKHYLLPSRPDQSQTVVPYINCTLRVWQLYVPLSLKHHEIPWWPMTDWFLCWDLIKAHETCMFWELLPKFFTSNYVNKLQNYAKITHSLAHFSNCIKAAQLYHHPNVTLIKGIIALGVLTWNMTWP